MPQDKTNVTININSDGTLQSGDDHAHVSQSTNNVRWNALSNGGPWTVSFGTNSPLDTEPISVTRGGASNPVSVKQGATNGTYSYAISSQSAGGGGDPDIIIET